MAEGAGPGSMGQEAGGAPDPGAASRSPDLIYGNAVTWRQAAAYEREAAALLQRDPGNQLANYVMAAIAEFSGDLVRMEAFLERTGLRIGMDIDEYGLGLHRGTERSYFETLESRQGRRPYFILSLPKSSSTFLCACIRDFAGLPRVRVSKGSFVTGRILPSWLRTFNRNGGVLHDHAPATPENLRKLQADPPAKLLLLVRDPVTAALSLGDYVVREEMDKFFGREAGEVDLSYLRQLDAPARRSALFQKFFPPLAAWLNGWLGAAGQGLEGCEVSVLKFEEVVQDSLLALSRIEAFFEGDNRRFDRADDRVRQDVAALFDLMRGRVQRTITDYRGKRPAQLTDTEQELVWRAARACPNLAQVYDLRTHLG